MSQTVPIILRLSEDALAQLAKLEADPSQSKRLKKVRRALGLLQVNRTHPSLNIHKLRSMTQRMPNGSKADLWEAYVENNTPGAWRIIYHLGYPGVLEVVAIVKHL